MQPDLLMARLGRLKIQANYVTHYTRYVIAPDLGAFEVVPWREPGRFIVIFAGVIQKGLAMQKRLARHQIVHGICLHRLHL